MSFLTVNGVAISVADKGAKLSYQELGGRSRSPDGQMRTNRTSLKRVWDIQTPILQSEIWNALVPMIQGRGDQFTWASMAAAPANGVGAYYSSKMMSPLSGKNTLAYRGMGEVVASAAYSGQNFQTYPAPLYNGVYPQAFVGAFEAASTNLLTSNQATGTDTSGNTTGFTALNGATLSSDSAYAWQGSKALKVVTTNAANDGVKATFTGAATTTYWGSLYVRSSTTGDTLRVYLKDTTNSITGAVVTVTPYNDVGNTNPQGWERVEVTLTCGAGTPTIALCVDTGASTIKTFWLDGLKVETTGNSGWPSSWVDGSAPATSLQYRLQDFGNTNDVCVHFRTRGPYNTLASNPGGVAFLLAGANGYSNKFPNISGYSPTGTLDFTAQVLGPIVGNGYTLTKTNAFADHAWHTITVVMRRTPNASASPVQYAFELYYDGVLAGHSSVALPPVNYSDLMNYLSIGSDTTFNSGAAWNGLIDQFVVLPYAPTASMISSWIAYYPTSPLPAMPRLGLNGDVVGNPSGDVTVYGSITGQAIGQAMLGGTWYDNAAALSGKFEEE